MWFYHLRYMFKIFLCMNNWLVLNNPCNESRSTANAEWPHGSHSLWLRGTAHGFRAGSHRAGRFGDAENWPMERRCLLHVHGATTISVESCFQSLGPFWPATAFGYFRFRLVYLCFLPPYIPIAIHSAIWHSGSSSISHRNCMLCTFCCHGGFIFQFQHSQVFFGSFGSISVCPVKLALKRWSLSN